jgi:hypothetical protein
MMLCCVVKGRSAIAYMNPLGMIFFYQSRIKRFVCFLMLMTLM